MTSSSLRHRLFLPRIIIPIFIRLMSSCLASSHAMSNGIKTNITPIRHRSDKASTILTSRQHPSRSLASKLWVLSTILPCTTTATRLCSWSTRKDSRDVVDACRSLTTPSSSFGVDVRLRPSVQTVNPQASSGGTSGVLSLQSFLHPTASSLLQVSRNYYQSETVYETDC